MLKTSLAVLFAAGLLAGCVYERNEADAPPAYRERDRAWERDRDRDRERARERAAERERERAREPARLHTRPMQASVPQPDRVRGEDLGALNPGSGTPGPDVDTRRPPRATPSPTRLNSGAQRLFIQAASFVTRDQAERARRAIAGLGPTAIYTAYVDDQLRYRVRLGPFATPERTDRVRAALIRRGYNDAIIVRD